MNLSVELQICVNTPQRKWTINWMCGAHILCLPSEWDGWLTVWKGFLATLRCTIAAFRTQNLCVWEERGREKKWTEGKENPSEIERHVIQQRKSGRFIHREGNGHKGGEREREQARRREGENNARGETK